MNQNDHLNKIFENIKKESSISNKQHYNIQNYQDILVQILPDKSVSPAKFKPNLLRPGHYKAHPNTILAMKKNIFSADNGHMIELERPHTCQSCKEYLDLQFWNFCPYCLSTF